MTSIPYDKGAAFLPAIELAVGRERFDRFLRGYFDRYAFQPMTTELFLAELRSELFEGDEKLEAQIDPETWIYGPGLPPNAPVEASDRFEAVEAQALAFKEGSPAAQLDTTSWTTHEWLHFLLSLPQELSDEQLRDLDETFGLSETGNSEILFQWLRTAIRNRYEPAFPALERFLTSQGRRKFLKPLYEDLAKTDWGREMALRIYEDARPTYHPVSSGTIDEVLGIKKSS
jgi:hypothetical protein